MKINKTVLYLNIKEDSIEIDRTESNLSFTDINKALSGLKLPVNIEDINQEKFPFFKYVKENFLGDSFYTISIKHKMKVKSLVKRMNKISQSTELSLPIYFSSYDKKQSLDTVGFSGGTGVGKTEHVLKFNSFFSDRTRDFRNLTDEQKNICSLISSDDIYKHSLILGRTGQGKSIIMDRILKMQQNFDTSMILDIGYDEIDILDKRHSASALYKEINEQEKEFVNHILDYNQGEFPCE